MNTYSRKYGGFTFDAQTNASFVDVVVVVVVDVVVVFINIHAVINAATLNGVVYARNIA